MLCRVVWRFLRINPAFSDYAITWQTVWLVKCILHRSHRDTDYFLAETFENPAVKADPCFQGTSENCTALIVLRWSFFTEFCHSGSRRSGKAFHLERSKWSAVLWEYIDCSTFAPVGRRQTAKILAASCQDWRGILNIVSGTEKEKLFLNVRGTTKKLHWMTFFLAYFGRHLVGGLGIHERLCALWIYKLL